MNGTMKDVSFLCLLLDLFFLQILYFESIQTGTLNRRRGILPHVKVYDSKSLSLMIAVDKASPASGAENGTWGSSVVCLEFGKYAFLYHMSLCSYIFLSECSAVCQMQTMNHFNWLHIHLLVKATLNYT